MASQYTIEYTQSSRDDMYRMRRYIITTFQYREYGKNFTKKMREARRKILNAPFGYHPIDLAYRGYDIRLLTHKSYLFFYITDVDNQNITVIRVLHEGMDWMRIIERWVKNCGGE